ncbi:MAG: hypothetical protein GY804_08180 [Alphaproteobacteria bacterium]|nr:hypothetical protein [Alphaproteobacteria bacterium]
MIEEIDYNILVENALKNVIKEALEITAERGLLGENHFYITFKTTHPEASVPASLKAQHPEEMTIVLQHQFLELDVQNDLFSVTLSFNGVNQRLTVPYDSIISFADPFATFGLQFSHKHAEDDLAESMNKKPILRSVDDESFNETINDADDGLSNIHEEEPSKNTQDTLENAEITTEDDENKVVMLDSFRNNNV